MLQMHIRTLRTRTVRVSRPRVPAAQPGQVAQAPGRGGTSRSGPEREIDPGAMCTPSRHRAEVRRAGRFRADEAVAAASMSDVAAVGHITPASRAAAPMTATAKTTRVVTAAEMAACEARTREVAADKVAASAAEMPTCRAAASGVPTTGGDSAPCGGTATP